jgi:hypothetical protein
VAQFRKLLEQATRDDVFSPFFITARHMEPEEVEYLENHESEPSATNTETPPSQTEWQWEDGDLVYNCHLIKEVFDDSIRLADSDDETTAKRYKLLGFVYNQKNNVTGLVSSYTAASDEFTDSYDLDLLESFLQEQDFLYENDTADEKIYTFTRPSDFAI